MKHFDFSEPVVLGKENLALYLSGVLKIEHKWLLDELIEKTYEIMERDYKCIELGPKLLTEVIQKHNLEKFVKEKNVFYPSHPSYLETIFEDIELPEESYAVHWWNGGFKIYNLQKEREIPEDSFLGRVKKENEKFLDTLSIN